MSKRRLSTFAVGTADWMQYRPYPRFAPEYDGFYLRLANSVFEALNAPERFFRSMLRREEMAELAVVLVSWFEDYANEIGLWQAFVRKNKELYGYELPFFKFGDYDPEDMNPADIAYLAWHYCCKTAHKLIGPDSPGLPEIAYELLEIFDAALEVAPGTDFYDQYLDIPDDIYFFKLKSKLYWMAFQNYLTGPEFHRDMSKQVEQLSERDSALLAGFEDPGKLIYTMQDDYLYKKNTSWAALNTPAWLAETARCSQGLRDDIRGLHRRIVGEFVYEGDEGPHYLFRHIYTKRLFQVQQESVTMKGIKAGELVFTTIVEWRGSWWVTGTLASFGDAATANRNTKKPYDPALVPFYAWTEREQQEIRDIAADLEAAYLRFFGDRLVFFKTEGDLRAALEQSNDFYNRIKAGDKTVAAQPPGTRLAVAPGDLPRGMGWVAFFEPGEGVAVSPLVSRIVHLLTRPDAGDEDMAALFFASLQNCSPALIRYLTDKYGTHNLRFPVKTDTPLLPYLDFLMRFYNPGAFDEVLPQNKIARSVVDGGW